MINGRLLLEALREIERTSPQKLDEPIFATYGNDENGNADIIPIQALLNGNGQETNGIAIVMDDTTLELLKETLALTTPLADRLQPEEYERLMEITKQAQRDS